MKQQKILLIGKKGKIYFQLISKDNKWIKWIIIVIIITKVNEFNNINNFNYNHNCIHIKNMYNIFWVKNNKNSRNNKNIFGKNKNDECLIVKINTQENLVILKEFQSIDYLAYLSICQDIKLCLNLLQIEHSLNQQIEEF